MGPLPRWRKTGSAVIHTNPWWVYLRDDVVLPSGQPGEYHHVETPGSVMVIPVDDDGRLLLVAQYRYLNDRDSLEFPGGGMHADEDPAHAAAAELAEEAGVSAAALIPLGTFNPYNGVTGELCTVYLARGLTPADAQPDPTEEFHIHPVSPEAFDAAVAAGEIWDGMTLAAHALWRTSPHHPAHAAVRDGGAA